MRIGIYGGSFNPIHNGHVFMAKCAIRTLKLDKLLIIPVGIPSHRENILVDGKIRMKMCKEAFKNEKKIEVLDIEIKNKELCYTYDTLLKIMELYKNAEIYEIVGGDSAENFRSWKNYKEILKLSRVVIFKRKGYKNTLPKEEVIEIETDYLPYSSTEIRNKIKNGKKIDKDVPKEVEKIIVKKSLYKR